MCSTLDIRLLGDFALTYGDEPLTSVNTTRLQSLLAYLLLHRDAPQSRRQIACTFWPDSSESQAMTNLRQLVHHLRRALPDADRFLQVEAQTLQWRSDAPFTLDVLDFERAIAGVDEAQQRRDREERRTALEQAVDLYQGDLFPACYEDWLLDERDRLSLQYAHTLEELIHLLEEQRDYETAIRYAQKLLRHDPLRETTYNDLMRLHLLNDDQVSALRVYQQCAAVLRQELDVEPGPATREMYQRVQQMSTRSQPASVSPPTAEVAPTPLVGRELEWRGLQTEWQIAESGNARFVLVSGEAGIGKTRLVEELFGWVHRQGYAAARTRSYAAEGRMAYAPVTDWLRSDALRPRLRTLDTVWRIELARLLPELLADDPDLPRPQPLTESWQRQHLFAALAHATVGMVQPLLLVIDDLQWCDQDTLEWLHYLLRFDPTARVLVVGTARPDEAGQDHPLQPLLWDLRREERLTELVLEPLDAASTIRLATYIAGHAIDSWMGQDLYQHTGGHPLFVVEMVRARSGTTTDPTDPDEQPVDGNTSPFGDTSFLPPKVQAIIGARLAQLSPLAQEIASLAAVVGRAFTVDVLVQAHESDEETIVVALDELWQRHIVREQGSDDYDFSHDRIREVAYGEISPVKRRLLHRRVAQALEQIHAADLDPVSGQLAAHYDHGGMPEQALVYYQRAAEVAQRVSANTEAINLLTCGLDLVSSLPASARRDERERGLRAALGISLVAVKGYGAPEVHEVYGRIRVLNRRLNLPDDPPILRAMVLAHVGRGQIREAYELGRQLLDVAQHSGDDPVLHVEAHYVLGVTLFWIGRLTESRKHLETAVARYDRRQHRTHTIQYGQDPAVVCLSRLALTLLYLGHLDQAVSRCAEALALARDLAHPLSQAYALTYAAWIAAERGDVAATHEHAEAVLDVSRQHQLGFWPPTADVLIGWTTVEQGDIEPGISRMRQGVFDLRATGQLLHLPFALTLLAGAYSREGSARQGLDIAAEAFGLVERTGERFIEAELYRLKGELLGLRRTDVREVEGCFCRALDTAREQDARLLELRAATRLADLWKQQGKAGKARELLAGVYDWFSEGFDTPDLQRARDVLIDPS